MKGKLTGWIARKLLMLALRIDRRVTARLMIAAVGRAAIKPNP